jgi:tetratricopeptide (TPR) repeat protein
MKKIVAVILMTTVMVFAGNRVSAQGKWGADSANCIKYLSFYDDSYKAKDFDNATVNWRKAYATCPHGVRQTMLTNGTELMRKLINKNKNNVIYRAALIDTLMALHEERAQFFPKFAISAINNKGVDIVNYSKDESEIFAGLNDVIARNGENTKTSLFIQDMNVAIELYKKGLVSAEDVINTYQKNAALLDKAPAKTPAVAEQNQKVKTDLESLFITSKVAECNDLITLFTPRYNESKDDLALVSNIVKMLSITEDCQDNDLFLNAVTSMYKLDPSYNSAYYLYRLNASRGNFDAALKYIDEAIAYETSDAITDAGYSFEAATFCFKNGKLAKAYNYATNSVSYDESFAGKAYFLIGQIWGIISCGGDDLEKRAHYWVAVDYLVKAKNADPSLTEEVNRAIGSYSIYFPEVTEAFMYNVTDGQSYRVVCNGMSANTTVRTRK